MVMRKHQRYFPVYSPAGDLQPVFVTVANGAVDKDLVRVPGRSSIMTAAAIAFGPVGTVIDGVDICSCNCGNWRRCQPPPVVAPARPECGSSLQRGIHALSACPCASMR